MRGAVSSAGGCEVPHGVSLADVVAMAGGRPDAAAGIMLGGYFGTWVPGRWAASLALDDRSLAGVRASLGALGQLLGYRTLWPQQYPHSPEPKLGVLARRIDDDAKLVYSEHGVDVILYEDQ